MRSVNKPQRTDVAAPAATALERAKARSHLPLDLPQPRRAGPRTLQRLAGAGERSDARPRDGKSLPAANTAGPRSRCALRRVKTISSLSVYRGRGPASRAPRSHKRTPALINQRASNTPSGYPRFLIGKNSASDSSSAGFVASETTTMSTSETTIPIVI